MSYSAWHTHIACVGVLVLFHWGCWPFPACPRTYLLASMIKARPLPSSVLSCTPSQVLRTSRPPSRLRALSAFRPYMLGLRPTRLPGRVSPVPHCSVPTCCRLRPRGDPTSVPDQNCCLLPSPCHERLGPPKHLSADNLTRLLRSLVVAARWFASPACKRAFDTPLGPVGSLLPAGVCYRALRRLPGQDFHLQEQRVFQDAPWLDYPTRTIPGGKMVSCP